MFTYLYRIVNIKGIKVIFIKPGNKKFTNHV